MSEQYEPRRQGINGWWLASVALIVGVLAYGGYTLFGRPSDPTSAAPSVVAASVPGMSTPASASSSDTSPCTPTDTASGDVLLSAPQTTWGQVEGIAVPTTQSGPSEMAGAVARCYSPDTTGAVTAAANIYLRMIPANGIEVAKAQVTPTPTEQELQAMQSRKLTPPYPQVEGFKVAAPITGNQVTVWLQLRTVVDGKAGKIGVPLQMMWSGTDWMIVNTDAPGDKNPSGYVPWAGA